MRFRKLNSLINESHINRCLILEAKEDIQKFVDKFGEENYELFKNSNQRLKNAGLSTDILWYVKNIDKDELEDILSKLQRRLKVDINDYVGNQENNDVKQSSDGIRGEYRYLGEKNGYKVYQPLDYLSSMDLGYMTGWCTAGRYGHAGEKNFKPSNSAAEEHFNKYTKLGVSLYYFLDSKTMEGLYAVALLPEARYIGQILGGYYVQETNIEIYNQADELDYSIVHKLPLNLIPSKIVLDVTQEKDGLFIKDNILLKVDPLLTKVKVPEGVISIGNRAFYACDSLTSVILPESLTSIEGYAFHYCTSLTSVIVPNSVTSIEQYAFSYCNSLTSVKLPASLTNIGYSVFQLCTSLTSITLPENLTSIGKNAFYECTSLNSIIIPNSVTSIGDSAFAYCSSLTDIIIPEGVTSIGFNAFYYCDNLTGIILPEGVTSIGYGTFAECPNLTSIVLPESITRIMNYAFANCSSLKKVVILNSTTIISESAFLKCKRLVIECHKGSSAEEYAKMNEIPVKYL